MLQFGFEVAQASDPGLGVLAHPPVVDEADRHGVQKVQLLATPPLCDDETGFLEQLEVLHHAEARHGEAGFELSERLSVVPVELIEELPAGRVGEGFEHRVHPHTIGDHLVTCQGCSANSITKCGPTVGMSNSSPRTCQPAAS